MFTKKTTMLLLKILDKATSEAFLHARLLNTLSYLEYIGSRKMIKSLDASILNKKFLSHINEETRHSLLLKSLAQKLAGKSLSFKSHEMIAGSAGSAYFQEVDHYSLKFVFANPLLNYLYTTYAVETRALAFYSFYNDELERRKFSFSLRSILNDEAEHLDQALQQIKEMDPLWKNNMEEVMEFEHQKHFSFLIQMEKELFNSPSLPMPFFQTLPEKSAPHYTA